MNSIATDRLANEAKLHLRLYTGPRTFESVAAISQVHSLMGSLTGSYEIEVLEGESYEEQAREDQASSTPILIRMSPAPVIRVSMPQMNGEQLRRAVLDPAV